MNKYYISFAFGFLLGGVIGAFASKTYFEKRANERADKEINEMKGRVSERVADISDETRNALHKNWNKPSIYEVNKDPAELEHPLDDDEEDYILNEERKADLKSEDAKDYYEKNKMKPPKIISVKDIQDFPEFFEETEWLYYKFDDVLTTEEDEVIEDYMRFIGDALDKYDFRNNEEETLYVVSYEYCTIYEITKLYLSYADKMTKTNKYYEDLKEYGYSEDNSQKEE